MADLVETYRGACYPWHCDHMGHMNVMWYVGKFDEATWALFAAVGLDGAALRAAGRGMAAVSQRIAYRREVRPGDLLVIRSGILEARAKSLRFVHEMRDVASGAIAALCELTALHIDTSLRKATILPDDVAARAAAATVAYDTSGF
jgi:acyl-CoA thioester hydrolase